VDQIEQKLYAYRIMATGNEGRKGGRNSDASFSMRLALQHPGFRGSEPVRKKKSKACQFRSRMEPRTIRQSDITRSVDPRCFGCIAVVLEKHGDTFPFAAGSRFFHRRAGCVRLGRGPFPAMIGHVGHVLLPAISVGTEITENRAH